MTNLSIRKVLLSPNHGIFAYQTEREGEEVGNLHFKDLSGAMNLKVYAHIIGTSQEEDILIYEDKDETTFVDISSTKDMKYITINANSLSSSEVRIIDALHDYSDGQLPSLQLVQGRKENLEYFVDHHDNQLYVLTNAGNAKNFKLVTAGQDKPDMQHWKDLITLSSTEKIEDVDLFKNRIVLYGRRDGLPMILCYDLKSGTKLEVDLPERFCIVHPGTNLDFDTDTFRFSVTSPYEHESTWEYNMDKKTLRSVRVHPIHTQVPVTLLHQKHLKLNGKNPVLMRSYGAYGITTDPDFRIENFSLLERGWVIALPHVSFKDFIAVAEHLINKNLTSSKLLAAMGTSAGGLLVGAMVHMRPELFKAIVLRVPFVDPLSAMLNPDLPLTQVEYPEWGNPTDDKADYENIASYSPYENIIGTSANSYPSVLLTGGLKDQRVQVSQPLKYISRLRREIEHSNAVALCRIDTDRGHFGGGGEQEARLDEAAEELAFLISNVQK
ncbi:prolyl oligopeptidase family-domain-containing protein [Umbelopsis sp. AD052]|nr:prolyl oligopeptidase family-domain-containing protein [Umbelopsis sp. AD052]